MSDEQQIRTLVADWVNATRAGSNKSVLTLMTEDALVLRWFPSVMAIGTAVTMTTGVGINWSLLAIGSGMIVGFRINASMVAGAVLAWIVAPYALLRYGVLAPTFVRNDVLFWVMWPATGLLDGLCAGQ